MKRKAQSYFVVETNVGKVSTMTAEQKLMARRVYAHDKSILEEENKKLKKVIDEYSYDIEHLRKGRLGHPYGGYGKEVGEWVEFGYKFKEACELVIKRLRKHQSEQKARLKKSSEKLAKIDAALRDMK